MISQAIVCQIEAIESYGLEQNYSLRRQQQIVDALAKAQTSLGAKLAARREYLRSQPPISNPLRELLIGSGGPETGGAA